MRILYITLEDLSLHKGSVVHIKEVVGGLRKRGHQVGLIGGAWSEFQDADHFYNINPKASFPFRTLRPERKLYFVSSILLFVCLLKVLRKYDVIYARDFHTVIIALVPRLIFGKKLVFEINGLANEERKLKSHSIGNQILAWFIKKAEATATRCCDRIVSVTQHISNYLTRSFHCRPEKIRVIGNGVNTERFYPIHDEALLLGWRKRFGIAKEDVLVAFVGNLALWQGVSVLVESAVRLLSRESQLKFLIAGEGLVKTDLEKRVLNWRLNGSFVFTGMVDYGEIPILINLADICVAPFIARRNHKTGVSPLKVFEYMACGKPVVASRIKGLEFVEEEGVGRLVDPEDVLGLEKALNDLIMNPKERMRLGQKGLQVARERFNWESKVIKIEEILKGLA
jgi:glycosyltransferase involved in cell wall biosynthesis